MEELLVSYPYGGKKVLLQWNTFNEGNNLILASCEQNMLGIIQRVFYRYPEMEIRGYCEIDIVAPSIRLCEKAAEQNRKINIDHFSYEIVERVKEVIEHEKLIPPQFAICSEYKPEADIDCGEWETKTHYTCENCLDTIKLVGMTKEELYDRYHEAWHAANPQYTHADKKLMPSKAERALDDEKLCYARTGFVSDGVIIVDPNKDEPEYNPSYGSCLFFFRLLRQLDMKEIVSFVGGAKEMKKTKQKSYRQSNENKYKNECDKRVDDVLEFFNKGA